MKIIFFCENANQVHISHAIANSIHFPSHLSTEIALLDWDAETTAWVVSAARALGWNVPVVNMMDLEPGSREAHRKASDKRGVLKDIVFGYLRSQIDGEMATVVQFNDKSVRGTAVAAVCRNVGTKRLLVQDGFLNFTSKSASLGKTDQNYGWGSTRAEMVAVWGQAMADVLQRRHQVSPSSVSVVGAAKPSMLIPEHVIHKPVDGDLKVLWADQAILDQRKAPKEKWLAEFGQIASALSNFKTELRLHPSTKEATRALLEESAGGQFTADLPSKSQMSPAELTKFDVVVTYYSTVFLDCIINNIPCVIYRTKSLDIELPPIDHPLLVYCNEIDDLEDAVRRAAAIEVNQDAPRMIFDYVKPEDGAENVAKLLAEKLPQQSKAVAPALAGELDLEVLTNAKRLQSGRILVLSTSFGDHIGVGKPIKVFYEYASSLNLDFEFHLVSNGPLDSLIRKVTESSIVIVNGFDVVKTLTQADMTTLAAAANVRGVPIVFYCHETQYVYRRILDDFGGRVQAFVQKILPSCNVLAVSDQQAEWLSTLGARSIRTVYNSVGSAFVPQTRTRTEEQIILMVGTQQRRKGVELFSRVADLARQDGLDWRFVWLGSYTPDAKGLYRSGNVDWHGHASAEEVQAWLGRASVFFLSSIDDPMPLSVGEALATGVPCVAYKETGFASFIDFHSAGSVFSFYEAGTALNSIKDALQGEREVPTEKVLSLVGVPAFGKRMIVALGEILISSSPSSRYAPPLASPVALHRLKNGKPVSPAKPAKKSAKMKFLDMLERNLPKVITRPGEKMLRAVGILQKR